MKQNIDSQTGSSNQALRVANDLQTTSSHLARKISPICISDNGNVRVGGQSPLYVADNRKVRIGGQGPLFR